MGQLRNRCGSVRSGVRGAGGIHMGTDSMTTPNGHKAKIEPVTIDYDRAAGQYIIYLHVKGVYPARLDESDGDNIDMALGHATALEWWIADSA